MDINYSLVLNPFSLVVKTFVAKINHIGSIGLDTVIKRILDRGTTLTKTDVISVLDAFTTVIIDLVLEGYSINTPLANFSVSLKGVFTDSTDTYDPARHQINAVTNPGTKLRKALSQASAVKTEYQKTRPNLTAFIDNKEEKRDTIITPNSLGTIMGHHLKYNKNDTNQGIFFKNTAGESFRVNIIAEIKPQKLVFMVPNLTRGEYTVEVRAEFKKKQDIRIGVLDEPLLVA